MATPLSDERPLLTLVKDTVEQAAPLVFKDQREVDRPTWVESARIITERTNRVANLVLLPHTVRGYRQLGRRWVGRYHDDFPQMLASVDRAIRDAAGDVNQEGRLKERRAELRAEYRQHRRVFAGKTAGVAGAVAGGVGFGAVTGSLWIDLLAGLGALGLGAFHGRDRSRPALAEPIPGLPAPDCKRGDGSTILDDLPEGARPFPISRAETPQQAALCVLAAAQAENVPIVEVSDVMRQPWGWQCTVRVSEGTPEVIIAKSGDLETRFDLPTNGVRPQPLKARRACAILRLVEGDPFATAPGLPYRAPKSMSITDRFRIGTSVGGDPLELSLAGVMGLWVAASGGGKTGILQALAEGTTACYDNITIDCDPHGDGLEDLGDCVRITARSNEQIEAVLLFFLVMSKARARLRAKLGMGKKWKASATHPAVTIFIDEFPKLSDLAKLLAFDLLLVGRKELIEVEYASQGGTSRYLGENIAQMMALKAVGPCKVGDTRAVFGDDSVREGYLPHKLSPATDTDPKDAGHIFIQGVPGMADEPIEYAIHEAPSSVLRQLATERLEAGLLDPDRDSLDAMKGVDLPEYVEPVWDNEGNLKKPAPVELLSWEQLLRLCGAERPAGSELTDGPARAAVEDSVTVMEKAGVDRMKTETLFTAVQDYDPDAYGEMGVDEFRALLKKAGAGAPITLGQIGEEKNPRGFKRDRLRHLL
jgi:S-DNA-T family DNA segregation ATPase FtsK/SpoIIIE